MNGSWSEKCCSGSRRYGINGSRLKNSALLLEREGRKDPTTNTEKKDQLTEHKEIIIQRNKIRFQPLETSQNHGTEYKQGNEKYTLLYTEK